MNSVHVDYPSSHIFLCGGYYDSAQSIISSMRGAFCSIAHNKPFTDYDILIAENVSKEFQARPETYDNLLSLESDLAQLSNIIVLFSESFGSAVELGAFCWDKNIPKRLLVVINEKHYEETSFVKLGPLKHLKEKYTESSICVMPQHLCDVKLLGNSSGTEISEFQSYMINAFNNRIKNIETKTTFNKNYRGHIILFLTGVVWYYHALNKEEIWYIADECNINIDESDVDKYMFCSMQFGWIKLKTIGSNEYYVSSCQKTPLTFKRKSTGFPRIDVWKVDVMDVWIKHDRSRFDAIRAVRRS